MASTVYNVLDTRDKTELETAIDGKANLSHTHDIVNITNLQNTLDTMQATLDSKAPAQHTHTIANITDLQTILDGKAAVSHTHTSANITDLQGLLDNKANSTHHHEMTDVTGLEDALSELSGINNGVYTLKNGDDVPASTNLDTMTSVGNYVCNLDETAATITNSPTSGKAFALKVGDLLDNGNCPYQEITRYTDGASWRRTYDHAGSKWNAWCSTSLAIFRKQLFAGAWSAGSIEVPGIQDYTSYVIYATSGTMMIGFVSYDKTRINCYGIICPERNVMRLESATFSLSGNTLTRDTPRSWTITGTSITAADGALVVTRIEGLF